MSDQDVLDFYRTLAPNYHLIFNDWHRSIQRQSTVLDTLLRQYLPETRRTVLDCACGIGTQALGLALLGYAVTGTDISPEQIERAKQEAANLGVEIPLSVADFRTLAVQVSGTFDAVIACDNAIAHLPTAADLAQAFQGMAAKAAPGGLVLVSVRDYDQLAQTQPRSTPITIEDRENGRTLVFQVWDWADDLRSYRTQHFTVKQAGSGWETTCGVGTLYAWRRADVMAALATTDLTDAMWHAADVTGYHQPIVTARKPV
jgi:glycine/sarcosine N-methyltransferase